MAHRPKNDRLRPWLTAHLDKQSLSGLEWIDKEKKIFKLPWKHHGKKIWNEKDGQIFKEWAIHTGAFRPGQDDGKEDYTTWKTRIRCAMHKAKDIKEMKEYWKTGSDETNPYRVYCFVDKPEYTKEQLLQIIQEYKGTRMIPETVDMKSRNTSCSTEHGNVQNVVNLLDELQVKYHLDVGQNQEITKNEDIVQPVVVDPHARPTNCETVQEEVWSNDMEESQIHSQAFNGVEFTQYSVIYDKDGTAYLQLATEPSQEAEGDIQTLVKVPGGTTLGTHCIGNNQIQIDTVLDRVSPTDHITNCQPTKEVENRVSVMDHDHKYSIVYGSTRQAQISQDMKCEDVAETYMVVPMESSENLSSTYTSDSSFDYEQKDWEMHVTIQYQDKVVEDMWTTNANGVCLYYGNVATRENCKEMGVQSLPDPNTMEPVHLPPCNDIINNSRIKLMTENLLDNLDRGLLLECKEGNIYATRLCRCSIFYTNFTLKGKEAVKLERRNRVKIFDYNSYQHLLETKRYDIDQASTVVQIGFGQRWNWGKPEVGVCVVAKVESMLAFNFAHATSI